MVRLFILGFGLLSSVGCITCNHHACEASLAPLNGDDSTAIARTDRNRVHVFIINGDDPFGRVSLGKLRSELNASGFAQVNTGGLFYAPWFESKIRRIHADDLEAKVILIGHGFGVGTADSMAAKMWSENIPLEGVIAISPKSLPGFGTTPSHQVRRIVISAKDATGTPLSGIDTAYSITDTGTLLEDSATAGLVLTLVREACQGLPKESEMVGAALAMIDDPAPMPRTKTVVMPPAKEPVLGILTGNPKEKK